MRKHCPTGKVEYATRPQAQSEINRVRKQRGINLSIYGCPHCLFFHLTKKADANTDSDLRRIAACLGAQITASETAYIRKRLHDIAVELAILKENLYHRRARKAQLATLQEDRRAQREILKELGIPE